MVNAVEPKQKRVLTKEIRLQYPVAKHVIDHVPKDKLDDLKVALGWMTDMVKKTG